MRDTCPHVGATLVIREDADDLHSPAELREWYRADGGPDGLWIEVMAHNAAARVRCEISGPGGEHVAAVELRLGPVTRDAVYVPPHARATLRYVARRLTGAISAEHGGQVGSLSPHTGVLDRAWGEGEAPVPPVFNGWPRAVGRLTTRHHALSPRPAPGTVVAQVRVGGSWGEDAPPLVPDEETGARGFSTFLWAPGWARRALVRATQPVDLVVDGVGVYPGGTLQAADVSPRAPVHVDVGPWSYIICATPEGGTLPAAVEVLWSA